MADAESKHSWVRIGATYGGVVAGAINALVYHASVQRGEEVQGGTEAEAGPGWYLVWVDEPHRHYQLAAPAAKAGATSVELDKNSLAALAEAGEAIEAKFSAGGSNGGGG